MHHGRVELFEVVAPNANGFLISEPRFDARARAPRSLTDEWPDIKRTRARPMEMDGFDLSRLD